MPRHLQHRPDAAAYLNYGRYIMTEEDFNLRAFGSRQVPEDVDYSNNLAQLRPHILERVRHVLVDRKPVSTVAQECGVKRQALYLNIRKFFVVTQEAMSNRRRKKG